MGDMLSVAIHRRREDTSSVAAQHDMSSVATEDMSVATEDLGPVGVF